MKDRFFLTFAVAMLGFVLMATAQQPKRPTGSPAASRYSTANNTRATIPAPGTRLPTLGSLQGKASSGTTGQAEVVVPPTFSATTSSASPRQTASDSQPSGKARGATIATSRSRTPVTKTGLDLSDQKQLLAAYIEATRELASAQAKLEAQESIAKLVSENAELRAQLTTKVLALEFQSLIKKSLSENRTLRERITKLEKVIQRRPIPSIAPAAVYGQASGGQMAPTYQSRTVISPYGPPAAAKAQYGSQPLKPKKLPTAKGTY